MKTVTLSSKNQIVIPTSVRQKLGISGGDRLVIKRITAGEVVFAKEPSYRELIGILPASKKDAVKRIRGLRDNW